LARQIPALAKRQDELPDFNVVERLLEDQQMVGPSELGDDVFPGVVGIRRTEHNQDFRIHLPHALDGFHAVQPGGMRTSTNARGYGRFSRSACSTSANPSSP